MATYLDFKLGTGLFAQAYRTSLSSCIITLVGSGPMYADSSMFEVIGGNPDPLDFYSWQQAVDMCNQQIEIPDGVPNIADNFLYTFYSSRIPRVILGKDVQYIGNSAFENQPIYEVIIPDGAKIEALGSSCFRGCGDLTNIDFKGSVTSIGDRCFEGCSRVTSLNLSRDLEYIPQMAFNGCSKLVWFNKGNVVNALGYGTDIQSAFLNCNSIDFFTFGDECDFASGLIHKEFYVGLGAGSNCNQEGLQITTIVTRNPKAIALEWVKWFNRYPVFVKPFPFIKYKHEGKWCTINGYNREFGDIPVAHEGAWIWLKLVDEGSPLASPLVFKHGSKWWWIAN